MIESLRRSSPFYILIDIFSIWAVFFLAYLCRFSFEAESFQKIQTENLFGYLFVFSLWTLLLCLALGRKKLHATDRSLTIPGELAPVLSAISSASLLVAAVIFFAKYEFFSRKVFIYSCIFLFIALGGFRLGKRIILRRLIAQGFHTVNVLIVGSGALARLVREPVQTKAF